MSLRTRLVLSLVTLMALGLAIYGVATYQAFANAELGRLDDELRASVDLVSNEMARSLGGPAVAPPPPHDAVVVAPGTYAELRSPRDTVIATLQVARSETRPDLDDVASDDVDGIVTVGSAEGDERWRVLAHPQGDGTLLVAVPMTGVERSLSRLLTIEFVAGAALLALLAAGAGLVLRRQLRPLERIADTAGSITAGELHRRVPDDRASSTEIARLAAAINGMLDELEGSFRDREASEARLRRFLADASHELRTPLTSIRGFAEVFRLDPDQRQIDLDVVMRRIEEESDRMRALVEDLLLLARLDEARRPATEDVDLAVLAADACSDVVAADPTAPVHLDAPEPLFVHGDSAHLRQALANLVDNAVRHSPQGTRIEVTARPDDQGRPTLTVRDHGDGLDDDALAHAFDRFWRADPARSGNGAGLGLSIVAAIAAEHGGEVSVDNHPSRGRPLPANQLGRRTRRRHRRAGAAELRHRERIRRPGVVDGRAGYQPHRGCRGRCCADRARRRRRAAHP